MVLFEMIKYHTHIYPEDIPLRTEEVSVHFDVSNIKPSLQSSLHTEYSYGKRTFNSELISKFPSLISAQKMVFLNFGKTYNGQRIFLNSSSI